MKKLKIIIENLSYHDYQNINTYKSRMEEFITNKYIDKIEEIEPKTYQLKNMKILNILIKILIKKIMIFIIKMVKE